MSDIEIQMGDKIAASALQLIYLCDDAIERYIEKLPDTNDEVELFFGMPSTLECARDAVIDFFKDNKEKIIKD